MSEVIYLVCSSTGPTTTSESNSNKFHKWVKQSDGNWLHTWGRVGDAGRSQTDSESKMRSKIRESLKNGYKQIEVAADVGSNTVNGPAIVKQDMKQKAIGEIAGNDSGLKDLVSMLVDRNTREITSGTTLKFNNATGLFQTDGGIIVTRNVINDARKILMDIKKVHHHKNKGTTFLGIDEAVCKYLMHIPTNIGRSRPTFDNVFPDMQAVEKQEQILDALLGSLDMLEKPKDNNDNVKVEEKRVWNLNLKPVDKDEFKRIGNFFNSTFQRGHAAAQAGLKPCRAWYLSIKHMDEAFDNDGSKVGGVKELWHGTRVGNLLSIFARGLIIPPWADAGRMFGDGIYFSDQSTKSLNYAYGYWSGGGKDHTCYMLLNDVAMGKSYIPKNCGSWKKAPDGFDSVFAKGGYSSVINNEMIVYRTSQCKVTRLVEFTI